MKKLLSLFFILTVAFASNASTFYSKATVAIASGEGAVYVSTGSSVDESLITGTTHEASQSSKGAGQSSTYADQTYYLFAKAAEGYGFKQWNDGSTDNPHQVTVRAESTKSGSPTVKSFTATFEPSALIVRSSNAALGIASTDKNINSIGDVVKLTAQFVKQDIGGNEFGQTHVGRLVSFDGWYNEAGELVSDQLSFSYTVKTPETLEARFSREAPIKTDDQGNIYGYYRLETPFGAENARYFMCLTGNFQLNISTDKRQLGGAVEFNQVAGEAYAKSDAVFSDAGSIFYVTGKINTNNINKTDSRIVIATDLNAEAQGTSTKYITKNQSLTLKTAGTAGYYLLDNSGATIQLTYNKKLWVTTDKPANNDYKHAGDFEIQPVDLEHIETSYFGATAEESSLYQGAYWTTMYTAFPYECYGPDGVEAYVVDKIEQNKFSIRRLDSGIVPANTPVILRCKGTMPKQNRLIPLMPNDSRLAAAAAELGTNLLTGDFGLWTGADSNNNGTGRNKFADNSKVLGINADGKLAFVPVAAGTEVTPNRAFLTGITEAELIIEMPVAVKVAVDSTFGDLGLATIDNEENSIGSEVTISASPNTISGAFDNVDWSKFIEFDGWYDEDGNKVSSDAVFTFTVEKMQTYTAKFSWINKVRDIGYYRVKNPATNQYWTIKGNFNPTPADFTDDESRKLNSVIEFSKANDLSDPGAVLRLHSDNFDDPLTHTPNQNIVRDIVLEAQGVTTAEILPGKTVDLRAAHNAGFFKIAYDNYQIASSRHNYSDSDFGYLYISDDLSGNNDSDPDSYFEFEPLDLDHIDQFYFGAEPVSEHMFDGGYMATMYTSFPFQCYEPDGVEAFTVTEITEDNEVILEKIADGFVPAFTPVVLKCHGLTAKENRLLPVYDEFAAQADNVNLLKGEFQLNESKSNPNKKAYDPSSMRVIGINDNGEAAFVTLDGAPELEANRAYLDLSGVANPAATYSFKYANGVPTGVDDIIYDQATDNPADAIYDLMGRRVDNPVKGRIYISKGKKYVF